MKLKTLLALSAFISTSILAVSGIALAQDAPAAPAAGAAPAASAAKDREPGGEATIGATATATVKAVDPDKRTVTLQTSSGKTTTIKCGKDVRNFDQIKVGDTVKAAVIDQVAVVVGKDASAQPDSEGAARIISRAPQGGKPGVIIADTAVMTDKIESVDAAAGTVTLQDEDGKSMTVKVGPDVDLSTVKKGDDITVRATKGLAIVVMKGPESAEAAQPAAGSIKPQPGESDAAMDAMSATSTVEAVDPAKRTVTLKGPQGDKHTIHLGKEAINFDQIKPGDKVSATLAEQVAVGITKGASPPSAGESQMIARAPKGNKPALVIVDSEQITGKIDAIDADKRTVTITEADGQPRALKVAPKVDLSGLAKGDDVTVRATQALAILVEKP